MATASGPGRWASDRTADRRFSFSSRGAKHAACPDRSAGIGPDASRPRQGGVPRHSKALSRSGGTAQGLLRGRREGTGEQARPGRSLGGLEVPDGRPRHPRAGAEMDPAHRRGSRASPASRLAASQGQAHQLQRRSRAQAGRVRHHGPADAAFPHDVLRHGPAPASLGAAPFLPHLRKDGGHRRAGGHGRSGSRGAPGTWASR